MKGCACGCGEPADRRSRYRAEHHRILVCARRKLRESRRNAARRGLPFQLSLQDVLALVRQAWPQSDSLALCRLDRSKGFVPRNMALVPPRGGRARRGTAARLRRRLERLIQRADVGRALDVQALLRLHADQRGRCALSGRPLQPHARLGSPDALTLLRPDSAAPWSPSNAVLVVSSVRQVAERWGLSTLRALARDIVRQEQQGRSRS